MMKRLQVRWPSLAQLELLDQPVRASEVRKRETEGGREGERETVVKRGSSASSFTHPAVQIQVPAAHLLEEREPRAQNSCLGSRLLRPARSSILQEHDPLFPTPAPVFSLPGSPASSFHSLCWEAPLLLPASCLLHFFSSFFVRPGLSSFLHSAGECCWACVVGMHVCLSNPPPLYSLHWWPTDRCPPRCFSFTLYCVHLLRLVQSEAQLLHRHTCWNTQPLTVTTNLPTRMEKKKKIPQNISFHNRDALVLSR